MGCEFKRITIRVSPEFKKAVLDICKRTGWNESEFVRKAIAYGYSHDLKFKKERYIPPKDKKNKVVCLFSSIYELDMTRLVALKDKYDRYGSNMSKVIRNCMENFMEVLNEDK